MCPVVFVFHHTIIILAQFRCGGNINSKCALPVTQMHLNIRGVVAFIKVCEMVEITHIVSAFHFLGGWTHVLVLVGVY